jgi:hypothetical protein
MYKECNFWKKGIENMEKIQKILINLIIYLLNYFMIIN